MIQNKKQVPKFKSVDLIAWVSIVIIWVVYSYLSFKTPSQQALMQYKLTPMQLNLLILSIIIPVLFIWGAILYGSVKLYSYSQTIIKSEDGKGFRQIGYGVFFFLISSIVTSYISLGRQFSVNDLNLVKFFSIFNNYLMVAFSLVSFYLIWLGSKKFIQIVKAEKKAKKQNKIMIGTAIILAIPYILLVLHNPIRSVSTISHVSATYNLPDILIFSTIVIPYVLSWCLGLIALSNMTIFEKETKGIFYKKALNKFYKGFWMIILFAIFLQYLTQFSLFFSEAALSVILLIIYVILVIYIVGFVFVAYGAKELTKIETV